MNQKRILEVLSLPWADFLRVRKTCTEQEAAELLEAEKQGACRQTMLMVLHQRYNVMRGRREREELRKLGMRMR